MRIRGYIGAIDYPIIKEWINDKKIHSLWCADKFTYPLCKENFEGILQSYAVTQRECAYIVTRDDGSPIGFFVLDVDCNKNAGLLRFVIIDAALRGQGCGKQILNFIVKFATEIANVSNITLNVFDVNEQAIHCYLNVGFRKNSINAGAFCFGDEVWKSIRMIRGN